MIIKYSNNYKVFFSYDEIPYDYYKLKKEGFIWSSELKHFITDDFRSAKKFYNNLDKESKKIVHDKCNELKKEIKLKEKEIKKSQAIHSDINIPHKEGTEYYQFQKAGIEYIINHKNILLSDEMGLGKTIEVIGYINYKKPENILIICPAIVKMVWLNELKKWLVDNYDIELLSSNNKKTGDITIINYDILNKYYNLINKKYSLIIVDEAHYIKNPRAIRSILTIELCKLADKKILITGTPIMNKPCELYNLLKALDFINYSFYKFKNEFLNKDYDEIQNELRSEVMIRRLKKDVLSQLPDKIKEIITLPENVISENKIKKEKYLIDNYIDLRKKINELKAKINSPLYISNIDEMNKKIKELTYEYNYNYGEMEKERHLTAMAKIPYLTEFIKNILNEENKVVVFLHHKDVMEKLKNNFKNCSVILNGDTPNNEREDIINKFNNDKKIKIFIGSIKTSGIGISLSNAHVAIFGELDWTPSNMDQAEDRLHRIGQDEKVVIYYTIVDNSIEAYIAKNLIEKQDIINNIIES